MEAIGRMQLYSQPEVDRRLSEAMSSITTSCQNAREALEERNLL